MIRIAAVGDLHVGQDSVGTLRPGFADVAAKADVLLLAGDLTTHGSVAQAEVVVRELGDLGLPTVAVLGNHDHHVGDPGGVRDTLAGGGLTVLERSSVVLQCRGLDVGVVGAKGFGGGFVGAALAAFGEEEMKAFARTSMDAASDVERLLRSLDTDIRILLLHYAPIRDTLVGEPSEIYPFLGSYLFAEAADRSGADLVIHGHAHRGAEVGSTPGGIPVRNVAKAVLRQAYALYTLDPARSASLAVD